MLYMRFNTEKPLNQLVIFRPFGEAQSHLLHLPEHSVVNFSDNASSIGVSLLGC